MKIGELARAASTPVETIRYYEREGLLPEPPRTQNNYRVYGDEQRDRLAFIRHCRSLDMTLDEIRVLLRFKDAPTEDCGAVNRLLDEHLGHVEARIEELRALHGQLRSLREQCPDTALAGDCGI
jgi:Cd(II)/Pb(II)-responsive transcriptional regulator